MIHRPPELILDVFKTTGGDFEMLAGNLASIGVGGIVTCVTSYFWPEDFNFDITRAINAPHSNNDFEEKPIGSSPHGTPEMDEDKKRDSVSADVSSVTSAQPSEDTELDPAMLNKAFRFAAWSSVVLVRPHVAIDTYVRRPDSSDT